VPLAQYTALQTGSLATTFTASQGLLLMIPNMNKNAGELTPTAFHVTARTLATHALSIFGDHSDVMFCRATGWGMLCSNSVQEAMDMALIAHAASLETRIPFLHFFDGFRTSHEVNKIEMLTEDDMRALINMDRVFEHRQHALSPDHPVIAGVRHRIPMSSFRCAKPRMPFMTLARAKYRLRWTNSPRPWGVSIACSIMWARPTPSAGAEAAEVAVEALNARGERVGLVKVRLYRPFSVKHLYETLPPTVRSISVLDRTKEAGPAGEPLYLDVVNAIQEGLRNGRSPKNTSRSGFRTI
jgi:pyruvate-ferredoxin/flavodoxin oxidoreductase